MKPTQNVVGPQVRKLRYQQGLTQEMFAARCATVGWDIGRGPLAKIESRRRCVSDLEVVMMAKALRVTLADLYPPELVHKSGLVRPSR